MDKSARSHEQVEAGIPSPEAVSESLPRGQVAGDRASSDVVEAVRVHGAQSRQEIVEITGLGRNLVSQRVTELITARLLAEGGIGPSTGGRPPRSLSFPSDAGHILVAFVGATRMHVAALGARARIAARRTQYVDFMAGPDALMEQLEVLLDDVREEAALDSELWAIGVALPGPVEFSTGRPIAPPIMPGWDQYPVRDRLSERFGVPVWVDNDVNAMAIGEGQHGVSRGHDDVIFVKIGTGIGVGLILDGHIYRGAQGSAGDAGHIQVTDDPSVKCRCGNTGCLEAMVGGAALAKEAERRARDGRSSWLAARLAESGALTGRDLSEGVLHGDPVSIELTQKCGHDVGIMLASAANLFNPSMIVVGGGVANAGDHLLAAMRQVVYGRSLPLATRTLQIQRSTLGDDGGVLGLASMVLAEVLSPTLLSGRLTALVEPKAVSG